MSIYAAGLEVDAESDMVLTFYLGAAAFEFKQYAAYVQRRTATQVATPASAGKGKMPASLTAPVLPTSRH
jgi:hypothetical protein